MSGVDMEAGRFPRELVLASAGTGKTFAISSRILGLLARGESPDSLLAATFTRKAAGEILNRVLERLAGAALDPDLARALEGAIGLYQASGQGDPHDRPSHGEEWWSEVLLRLLQDLHRIPVGTLDSFFIRVARSFTQEIRLPADWSITDLPAAEKLKSRALQEVFSRADPGQVVELVRMSLRGETPRGIHQRLMEDLEQLRALLYQAAGGTEGIWSPFSRERELQEGGALDREALADRLGKAPVPATARGEPHKGIRDAIATAMRRLRVGEWAEFFGSGPGAKALEGSFAMWGREFGPELRSTLEEALRLARSDLTSGYQRQVAALRRLAEEYDATLRRLQRETGAIRFEDVTRILTSADPVGERDDLWFRLDQQTRHLLLDEFQDTSFSQWEALRPLAEELLAGHERERSLVIVADPKQSIYGWRGAEPELVRRVGAACGLPTRTLARSYRSSRVVLELVNRVFTDLEGNAVWGEDQEAREIAGAWASDFQPHEAALALPGYVRLQVGPRDGDMTRNDRPKMMEWAAARIREIRLGRPLQSIGVLVRQNQAVSRLATELRALGVEVSEEGATTLIDSPAAATFLALLHMADHPGDTVASYQVAKSPLGAMVGLRRYDDPQRARVVADRVRRELLQEGYGRVLTRWTQEMAKEGALAQRDLDRLLQLVELGYAWEPKATLRPGDFVRFVRSEAVERPSEAPVRVMTVHQAKGLEFDVVVLPELDTKFYRQIGALRSLLPERDPWSGRVVKVYPRVPEALRPLLAPTMDEAFRQGRESSLWDALGVVYVALTRARHDLHLFLAADPEGRGPTVRKDPAGLIRSALDLDHTDFREGEVLLELGDSGWCLDTTGGQEVGEPPPESRPSAPPNIQLKKGPRRRFLPQATPSDMALFHPDALDAALRIRDADATRRGQVLHAWLSQLGWLEEGLPEEDLLRTLARAEAPELGASEVDSLLFQFWKAVEAPEIKRVLSRAAYPPGVLLEREVPFAARVRGRIVRGQMDRVVLVQDGGEMVGAEVLDFKSDQIPAGDEAALRRNVSHHRPQLETYRRALAGMHRLPQDSVKGRLVFLSLGRLVEVGPDDVLV